MPRGARIQSGADIRRLLAAGKRTRTTCLEIFVGASPAPHSRLGLIVPKLGRRIVDRNLLKRRLRDIGRRQLLPVLDAADERLDVLIKARGRAYAADFETLAREAGAALEELCSPGS